MQPAQKIDRISLNPGFGIGIAIEMSINSDADSDPERDLHKQPLQVLFMRLGAPPAHGGLSGEDIKHLFSEFGKQAFAS